MQQMGLLPSCICACSKKHDCAAALWGLLLPLWGDNTEIRVSACSEKNDCAAARWASLLRCRRYQAVVHQLRQELKASQGERSSLDHELEGAVLKASQMECREQTEVEEECMWFALLQALLCTGCGLLCFQMQSHF